MPARILVVEDDPASLELLRYILKQAGYSVSTASNGADGLKAALGNDHDLVLCDLQLPELSGFDIIARLKADSRWRPVPVVAVTAYSMPGDRDAAIAAGFSNYFTKPIYPETFLHDVIRLIPAELRSG